MLTSGFRRLFILVLKRCSRSTFQHWDEMPNVVPIRIILLSECDRGVNSVVLFEKGTRNVDNY